MAAYAFALRGESITSRAGLRTVVTALARMYWRISKRILSVSSVMHSLMGRLARHDGQEMMFPYKHLPTQRETEVGIDFVNSFLACQVAGSFITPRNGTCFDCWEMTKTEEPASFNY